VLLREVTFHVNGVVNRYNCRIWGSQNSHVTCELEKGSPKVNVWAGLMHDKLTGPFLFSETTVTGCLYLDMVKINDLQHLKAHIRDTMATVTPNMLQAT
jgi:hypothetical protein